MLANSSKRDGLSNHSNRPKVAGRKRRVKKYVAVSFENNLIKIVHVSFDHDQLKVHQARTLDRMHFEAYLEGERERDFVVVSNFARLYHDIAFLPPAQERFLPALAETEIRKRFPELREFTFFYRVIGKAYRDGKKLLETLLLAVDDEELFSITEKFSRHGKNVVRLYPSVLTLSSLVAASTDAASDPVLCVYDMGKGKMLFLVKEGQFQFVRVVQSQGPGIDAVDVESINMTITYVRQTMRLNPAKIVFVGTEAPDVPPGRFLIPAAALEKGPEITDPLGDDISAYMIPISALLYEKNIHWGNLVPLTYRALSVEKRAYLYSTLIFLVLSLAGAAYCVWTGMQVASLRSDIVRIRSEMFGVQAAFHEYEGSMSELQKLKPVVSLMTKINGSPDIQKTLLALQFLPAKNVKVHSLQLSAEKDWVRISLAGEVTADHYGDLADIYHRFMDRIKNVKGMEIVQQKLDLKTKGYSMQLAYRT